MCMFFLSLELIYGTNDSIIGIVASGNTVIVSFVRIDTTASKNNF